MKTHILYSLKMKYIVVAVMIILAAGAGCKSVQKVQTGIDSQKQQLTAMLAPIDSLERKLEDKRQKGELDEKTDSIVSAYIAKVKDSISNRLKKFDAISDLNDPGNKKTAIEYLNSVKESYRKELENILFFDELFDASTFSRLSTAAFFAPGQYMLSDTTYQKAKTIMDQLIGDALQFSSKYPSKKLHAMFVVTGFADEESIAPGSELYQSLSTSLNVAAPSRKLLNRELSSRRAAAIKDIMAKEYYLLGKDNKNKHLAANFLGLGKGEELPDRVTDYKPVDERRRVVLLYWSMLPELDNEGGK